MQARAEKERKTGTLLLGCSAAVLILMSLVELQSCNTRKDWDNCKESAKPLIILFLFECFLLGVLHETGTGNRRGLNLILETRTYARDLVGRFFPDTQPIRRYITENDCYRNIINGGAAIYDTIKGP